MAGIALADESWRLRVCHQKTPNGVRLWVKDEDKPLIDAAWRQSI